MNPILAAALVLALVGLGVAVMLVFAARVFHVEGAEMVEAVFEVLPGVNCGACGFPGCMGYAEAMVKEGVEPNKCVPGGAAIIPLLELALGKGDHAVADQQSGTADVVSDHPWPVRSEAVIPRVAMIMCGGGDQVAYRYRYVGLSTCGAANQVGGGFRECYSACQGLGDCARVCPFDAIELRHGLAVVNPEKCTGCSLCVPECPKSIITLVPKGAPVVLRCSNRLRAKAVSSACPVGCITCLKCEKECPTGAIKVVNGLPAIDYSTCVGSGKCVEVCPTHCLRAGSRDAWVDSYSVGQEQPAAEAGEKVATV